METIAQAVTDRDYGEARALFEEYAHALQVDLCFQNFTAELATLPTMYGSPGGVLLLARDGSHAFGCVGVRQLRDDICEMKRLYVRPVLRGKHVGRRLATEAVRIARALGYSTMVLDTLASMGAARGLYLSMGFEPAEAYYTNPLPEVRYLKLDLRR
jgi:GNAT superfamily N-acetyltransferase